ncbi:hypothetical protein GCM10010156_69210 [Planobispora rosea]|uniref:Uncharacterized protein n=1 Tax=Planobispora rosea TaxID=35762 RepID=A0A8J3S4P5_PLARO|nr:hypothetical protein [Planobispora rosea]GGT01442.1 hypothetical protein GCM10010156_69210 [Planobispora rosea]GIH88346.1 hypothetical protein Pro02_67540 [Planobispora rosea]
MTTSYRPFRWDLVRRDRLGTLLDGRPQPALPWLEPLIEAAAKVLARSGDGDLHFVGRSADSIFDLLSGALAGTSRSGRINLLPFSYRFEEPLRPHEVRQLRVNLEALGVSPYDLARRTRPIVFTDLVYGGHTFTHLYGFLREWIADEHETWHVIRRKLRFMGITSRTKTSPNTWRWWEHADWTRELPRSAVTNVSVHRYLWSYLGDNQEKITPSFRRDRWADETVTRPRHTEKAVDALAEAVAYVERGRSRPVRTALARRLAAEPAFSEAWLRTLALELRRGSP